MTASASETMQSPAFRGHAEIELRLSAAPAVLERLRQSSPIVSSARNFGTVRHLEAIYFDTPDRLLLRHGMSLRVRRSGRTLVETLKRGAGRLLTRQEWEAPVDSFMPDLARLPAAEIGAPIEDIAASRLAPIFSTKVRRHARLLELPEALVEIAFDEGGIEAGKRREAISEIELELKQGDAAALYELGLSLLDVAPLQLAPRSKAERGYVLAGIGLPRATKAPAVDFGKGSSFDAVMAAVFANCHHHLTANLGNAAEIPDIEQLHQIRVALRRLRTAAAVFGHELQSPSLKGLGQGAKALAKCLDPARAWDAFLDEVVGAVAKEHLPGFDAALVRAAAAPLQRAGHETAREGLASEPTTRFLLLFGRLIETRGWRRDVACDSRDAIAAPAVECSGPALARLRRKAMKRGRHFGKLAPSDRHRLRVTLKQLRYTAEFFLPLYAEKAHTRPYLKRLSKLQELLGAANDAVMSQPLVDAIAAGSQSVDVHRAIGGITGWYGRDGSSPPAHLRRAWHRFKAATPFWAA